MPTHNSGRNRLPAIAICPRCSVGPYTPHDKAVMAVNNMMNISSRLVSFAVARC